MTGSEAHLAFVFPQPASFNDSRVVHDGQGFVGFGRR
jgi:hypothetical protein